VAQEVSALSSLLMTKEEATQIAELLNQRNQLVKQYDGDMVLEKKDNYVFLVENNLVVACAEAKRVQWYQWEISHVSVSEKVEGKGFGSKILLEAESKAIAGGAKVLQCSIRSSNERSQNLFLSKGYSKTTSFFYPTSGNWVNVYQKSVSVVENKN